MLKFFLGYNYKHYVYEMVNKSNRIDTAYSLFNCGEFLCDNNYFTERDGVKSMLAISTLDGSGYLKYNDTDAILGPGSLVVVNCEKYHLYKTHGDSVWHFLWVFFNSETGVKIEEFINDESIFIGSSTDFIADFNYIKVISQKFTPGADIRISMSIHKIMSELATQKIFAKNPQKKIYVETVDKIQLYLDEHYSEDITAETLERITNLSKYYIIRIFKEIMNITPHQYLILMRITKSQPLLRNTRLSVEEIALRVGFTDINNYILNFRKTTGITPLQFRKTNVYGELSDIY